MQLQLLRKVIHSLRRLARAAGRTAGFSPAKAPVALPEVFDWKFYLDFYPDLRKAGLRTAQDAAEHYMWHGFFEKRFACAPDKDLVARHDAIRCRQLEHIASFSPQHFGIIKNDHDASVTVSVVITLYNYERYIEACLRSVLRSTFRDIEIIIVNDASTDNALALCRQFLACGVPFTIVDKAINTGLAHSRNLGIRHARGRYIFILDADNEIYPACLEKHLACMRADGDLVACYSVIDVFDEDGRFCGQVSNAPFDFEKLLRGNYIDAMAMFDRQALIEIGMYDEALLEQGIGYEDYDLWLRIGQQGKKVGCIEWSLSRYLKKNESMLAVSDRFYSNALIAWMHQKYAPHGMPGRRTAVLVVGMHRSGTSALTGLLALMGAYPGSDLIGPERSNAKGHFEPRKIVVINDALLNTLGAHATPSASLPANWMERNETHRVKDAVKKIILDDYSGRDIFVIKDPRLCLLLPLYRELCGELGIDIKIITTQRDVREVIRSLHDRDGLPHDICRAYYEKHIRALDLNLSGLQFLTVTFDQLIETPAEVMEKLRAFIPRLSPVNGQGSDLQIRQFIDPGLRHHRSRRAQGASSLLTIGGRAWDHLCGRTGGPDFLIIGAQRAGTTALYHYLCAHPQIQTPAKKELHWFHAGPQDGDDYHNGHRSRQWYERQLAANKKIVSDRLPHRCKLAFEASPEYLYHPLVPQKVFQLYPAIKLIVLLRDPLERAVSQYYHEKRAGFVAQDISIEDYFAGDRQIVAAEESKLMNDDGYFSYRYEHCCPVARSDYGRQLGRWLRCFSRDRMLILRSEDLFCAPMPLMDAVCAFLGIECRTARPHETPVVRNSSDRPPLSAEQRDKLAAYFPFDLSLDMFCGPPGAAIQAEQSGARGGPRGGPGGGP